jgi:cytochrome c oxidase subunit IV
MPHLTSRRTYLLTALALLVLTAVTYAVRFVDLGPFNTVVALAIAAVKAALIVLIFMHARFSGRLTRLVILISLALLIGLIVGILDDYISRPWIEVPGK